MPLVEDLTDSGMDYAQRYRNLPYIAALELGSAWLWKGGLMSDTWDSSTKVLNDRLRLGAGFGPADRGHVLELMSSLTRHLARWKPEKVDLEISVKDRTGPEQKITLEAQLPGLGLVVATSAHRDLDHALIEARKELIRQIDDEKDKRSGHKAQPPRQTP